MITLLIIALSLLNSVDSFWVNNSPCISKSLDAYISPTGHTIINVATVQELDAAMYTPADHTTILIADGTYNIDLLANKRLQIAPGSNPPDDIIIRSASGIRENVILTGAGQYSNAAVYGIELFPCTNVVIADLTIKNVYYHTIQIHGGCSNILLHNLHLIDAGEQIVKVSSGGIDVPGLIIQFTLFELTNGWAVHPELGEAYGNGISAHNTTGLHIHDCQFVNLYYTNNNLAGPSILVWNYARDSIIERNLFYHCSRGIQFGAQNSPHYNGIIKNNFFYRPVMSQPVDVAFYTESSNSIIAFNTIYVSGSYYAPIEIRWDTTINVLAVNNILDSGSVTIRNNANAVTTNNFISASDSGYFQDLTNGDLHLINGYSGVSNNIIGKGMNINGIIYDIDHKTINFNSIDIGAHQISSSGACIATNSPTMNPSQQPTINPTEGTMNPSKQPTNSPIVDENLSVGPTTNPVSSSVDGTNGYYKGRAYMWSILIGSIVTYMLLN
eukprot:185286_1